MHQRALIQLHCQKVYQWWQQTVDNVSLLPGLEVSTCPKHQQCTCTCTQQDPTDSQGRGVYKVLQHAADAAAPAVAAAGSTAAALGLSSIVECCCDLLQYNVQHNTGQCSTGSVFEVQLSTLSGLRAIMPQNPLQKQAQTASFTLPYLPQAILSQTVSRAQALFCSTFKPLVVTTTRHKAAQATPALRIYSTHLSLASRLPLTALIIIIICAW